MEVLRRVRREVLVWGIAVHKLPIVFLFGVVVSFWSSILLLFRFVWGVVVMFGLGEARNLLVLSSRNTLVLVVLLFVGS